MRRALWVAVEKHLVLIGAAVDFVSQRNSSGAKKPDMEGAVEKTAKVKGDTYYGKVAQNYETRRRKQSWWGVWVGAWNRTKCKACSPICQRG